MLWINERSQAAVFANARGSESLKSWRTVKGLGRSPRNLRKSRVLASLLKVSRSVSETDALEKLLEPRIGAQGIEARSQEDARVKSPFVSFL